MRKLDRYPLHFRWHWKAAPPPVSLPSSEYLRSCQGGVFRLARAVLAVILDTLGALCR